MENIRKGRDGGEGLVVREMDRGKVKQTLQTGGKSWDAAAGQGMRGRRGRGASHVRDKLTINPRSSCRQVSSD